MDGSSPPPCNFSASLRETESFCLNTIPIHTLSTSLFPPHSISSVSGKLACLPSCIKLDEKIKHSDECRVNMKQLLVAGERSSAKRQEKGKEMLYFR